MTEYREIIRRFRLGQENREIQRDTGFIGPLSAASGRSRRQLAGWLDLEKPLLIEEKIQRAREGTRGKKKSHHLLYAYVEEFRRWVKEERWYVVMHQLIKDCYPSSEVTVRKCNAPHFSSHR